MQFFVAASLALAALTAAAPSPKGHVRHEKRDSPPAQWVKRSRVASDAILPVRIGLTQSNLHKAGDYLMDV
jgi:tripeptidyl-peptidase I